MTTEQQSTVEELEAKHEELQQAVREAQDHHERLSDRYGELEEKIAAARLEAGQIGRRLERLEEERAPLGPRVYEGDAQASLELEAVDDEAEALRRRLRVVKSAVEHFERLSEESEPPLRDAELRVGKAKAAVKREELAQIRKERDASALALVALLEAEDDLLRESFSGVDRYERLAFLKRHFSRYLVERFLEMRPY